MLAPRRPIVGSLLGVLLLLTLVAGLSAASSARAAAQAVKISASLSESPFAPNEIGSVRLLYRFSGKSSSFGYRLLIKKGTSWRLLRSVSRSGSFKGSHGMTVAKVIGKRKIALGHYRLELSAGASRTTLSFDVVKALKATTVRIGAADTHSCAIISGGRIRCWGGNAFGQLGNRSTIGSATPVAANGIKNAKALSTGGFNTCAVVAGGLIECWGDNANGKLGTGFKSPSISSIPISVSGIVNAVAVSSGADHSCALLAGGAVKCWGRNNSGDIGGSKSYSPVPLSISGIAAKAISAGYRHSCAVLSSGKVACWGNNHFGQLGNGKTANSRKPVTVSGLKKAIAVSAGNDISCAVLSNHTAKCWGRADGGALGDGAASHGHSDKNGIDFKPKPATVKSISNASSVSAGSGFGCARLSNKQIKCWGKNSSGQLGNGATADSSTPVLVSGISAATAVSASAGAAGESHVCALVSGGEVKCWGKNDTGQLGGGAQNFSATPVADVITSAGAIAAGGEHSCALLSNGTVACWGDNSSGQLGNGTTTSSKTPVPVSGVTGALVVAAGSSHSCAVLSTGAVDCWGENSAGQLGDGTTTGSSTPVLVSGITAKAVAAGSEHSCALLSDGTVKCWGRNLAGQLGDGTTTSSSSPVLVTGITTAAPAKAIAAGFDHTCALLSDGTVKCWGSNSAGQLGDGTTTSSSSPVLVTGITTVTPAKAIAAGFDHTCALLSDGTVKCWGGNSAGQLGNGSTTPSPTPVAVSSISGVLTVSAGLSSSCAVLSTGAVDCWGDNNKGKLGNGSTKNSSGPVAVADITGALDIGVGASHTCALLTSGAVRCWGDNALGELGVGALDYNSTPVEVVGVP